MKSIDKYKTSAIGWKFLYEHKVIFSLLVLFFICQIFTPIYAKTPKNLKAEQAKIKAEASEIATLLSSTKKEHKVSLNDLRLVKQQIANKKSLIESIANEIGLIDGNIEDLNQKIEVLENKFEDMKRTYAETIRKTYRSQNGYSKLMFLFSSNDFNDAYKRYKYIQYYTDYRKGQFKDLNSTKESLRANIDDLEVEKNTQKELLGKQKAEKKDLEKSQKKQEEMIAELKQKEKVLMRQLSDKKEAVKQLDQEIKSAIEKARREAAAAQKAREMALAARKKQAAKQQKKTAITKTPTKKKPAKEIKVSNSYHKKTGESLFTPAISTKRAKKFAKNKGKLPWPVSQGVVVSSFGTHPHPIIKNISITNNGIDIATGKGALVKAIHDGVVASKIYTPAFKWAIIVKHDDYFTVYTNLKSASVNAGDKVNVLQPIGVASRNQQDGKTIVHLEVWKGEQKMNPIKWIKRKR